MTSRTSIEVIITDRLCPKCGKPMVEIEGDPYLPVCLDALGMAKHRSEKESQSAGTGAK